MATVSVDNHTSSANPPEQTAEQSEPRSMFRQSPSINKLAEALAKAQGEFETVKKDSENPYFKSVYADLASVITATRQALSKHGLSVIQSPKSSLVDGQRCVIVATMMLHSSGEWIADELAVPIDKAFTAQSVGSAVTYARRYALQAFLCVAGEDDDGNAASGKKVSKIEEESEEAFDQRTDDQKAIVPFQITAIDEACKRTGKSEEEILAYLGLIGHKRIEHVLKSQFQEFLKWANSTTKAEWNKAVSAKSAKDRAIPKGPTPDEQKRMAANKRLWALAAEHSIPEGDVKTCAYEKYNVDSMSKLSTDQLVDMAKWVEDVASAVNQS